MMLASLSIVLIMRASCYIEKKDRCMLLIRSFIGTAGFTMITFGVSMVPLTVQNTVFNTAPIWASILGYFCLGEAITSFEIVALVLSFGAVVSIALAKEGDEGADSRTYETGS